VGVAVSSQHFISAAPSSSHSSLASVWGPTHGVLQHRLLQHRSLPRGAVLQEQTAPVWVPHRVLSANLLQCGLLSAQVHSSCQDPAPARALHGLQLDLCSAVDLHGLQGIDLRYHGLILGLLGTFCSGAWSTSSTSFFSHIGVCRAVSLTLSHSRHTASVQYFLPFLKEVTTEVPPALLTVSATDPVPVLEPAGAVSV